MSSNRPFKQLKIVAKEHDNLHVPSLKELALREFALTKNGLFSPTEREYQVLMATKNGTSELTNTIKTDLEVLLQHIAYGEQAEAEKMIDASPHLLLMSGTVVNYSLQTIIDVTPVQLAFGGNDEVMCAMLKERLGEAEFLKQISERFHEDAEAEKKAAAEFDEIMNQLVEGITDPLANIKDELNHMPNESPLRNLLDNFRVKFSPVEVKVGKHFNVQFLLKALDIYYANDTWPSERRRLFWRQVVGYLERLLPVSYVQAGCQGIENIREGEPLKRLLKLVDGSSYYPLDANPANRLGSDHGIHFGVKQCERAREDHSPLWRAWVGTFL